MASLTNKLSGPEFEKMLAELRQLSAEPTLDQIKEVMVRHGIKSPTAKDGLPSRMAAATLRDGPFQRYLERLNAGREAREQLCAAAGAGKHALDAIEEMMVIELQDHLTNAQGGVIDIKFVVDQLTKLRVSISMREDSQRKQTDLERKLRETEARIQTSEQSRLLAEQRVKKLEAEIEERAARKVELLAKIEGAKKKGGLTKETLAKIEQEAKLL